MNTRKKRIFFVLMVCVALGPLMAGGKAEKTEPVKIGMYADLSASTAQWGTDAEKGAKLKVKEVNAEGGILGRPVQLIVYDIKTSPTEAVRAYTRLAQED